MEEVIFTREGQLGLITLNRPKALNALTLPMIQELQKQLSLWKEDERICAIIIQAVPGNAFCAGGDVRGLYHMKSSNVSEQLQFFWHEYRLNQFIHQLGKPYVALMDGITMGGGVGISLHGSHPVATERFVFAMPETGIGFFPDIGASYLLSHCPDSIGMYLGLTGNSLGPQDALKAGLVRYTIPSESIESFIDELHSTNLSQEAQGVVTNYLDKYSKVLAKEELLAPKPIIQECFSQSTVESIRNALRKCNSTWADKVNDLLSKKSPLSLKVTYKQLQKAKNYSLEQCLKMDYDLVGHFMRDNDFYEGVRALLIDKDKNPNWNPKNLQTISENQVIGYFEGSAEELKFIQ